MSSREYRDFQPATSQLTEQLVTELGALTASRGNIVLGAWQCQAGAIQLPRLVAAYFPLVNDERRAGLESNAPKRPYNVRARRQFDHVTQEPRTYGSLGSLLITRPMSSDASVSSTEYLKYELTRSAVDAVTRLERVTRVDGEAELAGASAPQDYEDGSLVVSELMGRIQEEQARKYAARRLERELGLLTVGKAEAQALLTLLSSFRSDT